MKFLYCNHELIKMHIAEAVVMAGLPKSTDISNLGQDINDLEAYLLDTEVDGSDIITQHLKRGKLLGNAKPGSGHDCFLKGVVVTAVVTAPAYQWPQIQRYHFLDIISSQSKMHKITKMNIKAQCNEEVDDAIIDIVNGYIELYNNTSERVKQLQALNTKEAYIGRESRQKDINWLEIERDRLFKKIINNAPQGLHLAAGIVTNYLQLKTMRLQRKGHKLEEWTHDFVSAVDALPYFSELTGVKNDKSEYN